MLLQGSCEVLCTTLLVDLSPLATVVCLTFLSFAVNTCTQEVNNHHAPSSSAIYTLQFAGKVKSIVKILCDLHIKFLCYVHVIKAPYFDQIVPLQTSNLADFGREQQLMAKCGRRAHPGPH